MAFKHPTKVWYIFWVPQLSISKSSKGQNWWLKVVDRWPIGAIPLVSIDPKHTSTDKVLDDITSAKCNKVCVLYSCMRHPTCVVNFDRWCSSLCVTMPTFFFIRWEIPSIWTLEGGNSKFDRWENPPGVFKLWKKIRFLLHISKVWNFFKNFFGPNCRPIKEARLLLKRLLPLMKYMVTMNFLRFM